MSNMQSKLGRLLSWVMLGTILLSTGCAQATAPEMVAAVTTASNNTVVPTTPVPKPATALPTATTAASSTVAVNPATQAPETAKETQSATPPGAQIEQTVEIPSTALENVEKGFSAWCLPLDTSAAYAKDPLAPPGFAKKAKFTNGTLELRNLPASGCMFLITFSNTAPTNLKLEVYEMNQPKPFFKADLQPTNGSAETLWTYVQHAVIVSPGTKSASFSMMVRDPLGQVLEKAELKLYSWVPGTPAPQEKDDEDCSCEIELP